MAFDFPEQILRSYVNRTSNDVEQIAISYSANQPFHFSCKFKANWDGIDDKYIMSLQNGNASANVFNIGIYNNRLMTWSGIYDTSTLTFYNVVKKLDLIYQNSTLKVYLDNSLVNTRTSYSIPAATYIRVGAYDYVATSDSWIGELWDWSFTIGTSEYVAPTGRIYLVDGPSYTTKSDTRPDNPFSNSSANLYRYRTIYTHGYVSGGYKDSSPWKNTNRTVHSTDTTSNLGDRLDYGAAYVDGGQSDYNLYVYGVVDAFSGSSTWTSSVSMVTEAARAHSSTWDLKTSRDDLGCIVNSNNTIGYISGGNSSNTDKHNYTTETMYALGSVAAGFTSGNVTYGATASWYGETRGWIWAGGGGSLAWSTETWSNGGVSVGTDGWGKALSSKHGHAYVKNGGNTTNSVYKINDNTGANINTGLTTPDGAAGEENYEMGQNKGYCLGHYNGAQNNNTYSVNYITDVFTSLGATAQPKGHDGMSSGATASASSTIVGALF